MFLPYIPPAREGELGRVWIVAAVALAALTICGLVIHVVTRDVTPEPASRAPGGAEETAPPPSESMDLTDTASAPEATVTEPTTAAEPDGGLFVLGTVRDTDGNPLVDHALRWIPTTRHELRPYSHDLTVLGREVAEFSRVDGDRLRRALASSQVVTTDSQGNYRLRLPEPMPPLSMVVAVGEGYEVAAQTVLADAFEEGIEEVRVEFTLRLSTSISGRVTDADTGDPVAGMVVHAGRLEPGALKMMAFVDSDDPAAVTDGDGRFAIHGLAVGEYRVLPRTGTSDHISFSSAQGQMVVLDSNEPVVEVDFRVVRGGRVYGRVLDPDGNPQSGVRCGIFPEDLVAQSASGKIEGLELAEANRYHTAEDGFYEFRGLPFDISFRVTAREGGFAPAGSEAFALTEEVPELLLDVNLTEGFTLSGHVQFPGGEPAPGVEVHVAIDLGQIFGGNMGTLDQPDSVESDQFGAFRFEHLSIGKVNLYAGPRRPQVFGTGADVTPIDVDGTGDITGVVVTYEPGISGGIAGTVVDDEGNPVEMATVRITKQGSFMGFASFSGNTDEEGHFQSKKLDGAAFSVVASKSGYTSARLQGISTDTFDLELAMVRNATVSGRVLTTDGSPPGVEGSVRAEESNQNLMNQIQDIQGGAGRRKDLVGQVRKDGTFSLQAGVGFFEIIVSIPGFAPARSEVLDLSPGDVYEGLELRISTGATLRGKVTLGGNTGVEGAAIDLKPVAKDGSNDFFRDMMPQLFAADRNNVVTDEEGNYVIEHLAPGEYRVSASHPQFAPSEPTPIALVEDQVKTASHLVLTEGGELTGRLVEGDGAKVGLLVQVMGVGVPMEMATSDHNGSFEFKRLRPGAYSVVISDMRELQQGKMMMKQRSVEVLDGQTTELEVVFGKGVRIHGVIAGLPPAPFRMAALRRPGGPTPEELDPLDIEAGIAAAKFQVGIAMVTPDGSYEMADIEPGTYILEVLKMPDNPMDLAAYSKMDRTPHYRKTIHVGDEDLQHDAEVD